MKAVALKISRSLGFNGSSLLVAFSWFMVGVICTYLTTTTAEAQISGEAFCSLFTNNGNGFHNVGMIGHCAWCYAAVAAFGASMIALFKKA